MPEKRDTDPQSLRATADRLSALGVLVAELQAQTQDLATAIEAFGTEQHDIKTFCAMLSTDVADLDRRMNATAKIIAALPSMKNVKKALPTSTVSLKKPELALMLLALFSLALTILVFLYHH